MRKYWIILVAALAILLNLLVTADRADAAYADAYGYGGIRWKSTTICVQNQLKDPKLRAAVYKAVVNIRDTTNLHVVNYGSSSCSRSGHKQIIYATQEYSNSSWMGMATPNGYTWGTTPNKGLSTWFYNSGAKLRFNTKYLAKYPDAWEDVAAHELAGHLMGLGHRDDTCKSVVSSKSLSSCGWNRPDSLQYVDRKLINTIYSW